MQKKNFLLFFMLLFWGHSELNAQKVDFSLQFNASANVYEIFAKSDFTKGEFLINEGSQITVLIPIDFMDERLTTVNYAGKWSDQKQIFAPKNAPESDFHVFTAEGGTINFTKEEPVKLFSFQLPLSYDHQEIRLFVKDIDPSIRTKDNQPIGNFFENEITKTDFYHANYDLSKEVTGHIKDWRGYPMENVSITLGNQTTQSLYDGRFEFKEVLLGDETNFTFQQSINPTTGITTADLIHLQHHLTGKKVFDQAYQWVAADLDNSGTITYNDLELLKQVINNEFTEAGWRVLPTNWLADKKLYQTTLPNTVAIRVANRTFSQDFTAIKLGDIDGSHTLKANIPTNILPSAKALTINVLNEKIKAGKPFSIPFSTSDFRHLTAYQASLKIEDAKIVDLANTFEKYPGLDLKQLSNDTVIVNWLNDEIGRRIPIKSTAKGNEHKSETAILDLTIIPAKDGLISDFITLLDNPVQTEAYDNEGKIMTLQLLFRGAPSEEEEFILYQNKPNPFREVTEINYYLPEDGAVKLTLINETGQIIKVYNGNGQKGFNSFSINGDELTKGVIIYQLKTDFGELTKKMLLLN